MDLRKLLGRLSDGRWHCPIDLSTELGTDVRSLNELLACLRDHGLEITVDAERGVCLSPGLSLLAEEEILAGLRPEFRDSLVHFELPLVVDSTNTRAIEWLRNGNSGRALFLAERQHSGRGRRGRSWVSPMGRNLTMSLVWPVVDTGRGLEGISLVVALSLVESLRSMALQGTELLGVKWPNDVWLGGAKLAGILLELQSSPANTGHVVIGMGLNVHLPLGALTDVDQPVSDLYSRGNRQVDRNQLVVAVLTALEHNLETLHAAGFQHFRQQWLELDIYQNRQVEVTGHGQPIIGLVSGISTNGALILQTEEGEQLITGGEIAPSVRPLEQPAQKAGKSR
jgi:BirA family biotin operon repressor/biotin-[acetyl-CoA-carboxylase] ligase